MSAQAAEIFEDLRRRGVASDLARAIAEAFDARLGEAADAAKAEAVREAIAHMDRNRAESEEKMAARFVSQAEQNKRDRELATRADISEVRGEIAELRAEMNRRFDAIYRILVVMLLAAIGAFASALAVAVKVLFGF